jgi:hypothetical protein
MRLESNWLAPAALRGFTLLFLNDELSNSFSEDISLLVMVSLLGRPLPTSTASNNPLRNTSSGGRDGDVIMSEGLSPASASSLRRADPGMGDDPERVRSGILVNLIWLAGLAIRQFSLHSA